ncbi:MAG: hypothetical protein ACJ744_02985 [Gaiellaceae bacterium]
MRFVALSIVVVACLAVASPAAAHSRAPTVALDYRVEIDPVTLSGVHVDVVDGDRAFRVRVDAPHRLLVRGLVGEPLLRFAAGGVWVNSASPTAAADRLATRGSGWLRVTRTDAFLWHDHRLTPPPGLRAGASAGWSLPVELDGRPTALRGTFTRVGPPPLWPWILAMLVGFGAVAALARALPERRPETAAAIAAIAAAGALTASTAFATGDTIARRTQWLEAGSAGILALFAAVALLRHDRSLRTWAAIVVGVVAVSVGLGSMSVFRHGIVVSSLPASFTRLATAVALVGGASAVVVAVLAPSTRRTR